MLLRYVIGGVLRRLRLGRGMTLEQVARRARVSVPYLSEIERGRKEASSEVLAGICEALGLTLAELLHEAMRDASQRIVTARSLHQRRASTSRPVAGRDRGTAQCRAGAGAGGRAWSTRRVTSPSRYAAAGRAWSTRPVTRPSRCAAAGRRGRATVVCRARSSAGAVLS